MDHLLVRVGQRQVLLVDVCSSADGHGIGYGIILKRIERALRFGAAMGASVFFVREAPAINRAVFRLRSQDVEILPRSGLRAVWLRGVWLVAAPFRLGHPGLWAQRVAARAVLSRLYPLVEQASWLPRAVRRFVMRPRPLYRRLKAANAAYASLSTERWKRTFKEQASVRLRTAEREGRPVPLRLGLPPEGEREAMRRAALVGLTPTDRIVTVHVRELGYRANAGLSQRPLDLLRNARVDSYREGLRALVARGYRVVRLGDPSMTPVEDEGIVDLARSPHRTEWLEAWCIQRSAFLIGCDSGPSWLAFLFDVPVLTVNALHFRDIARPKDRVICKRVRERSTSRVLSVAEMLTEDYLRHGLDTKRYEHMENDPADLARAMLDMIEVVEDREEPSPSQRHFVELLTAHGARASHEWTGMQGVATSGEPRGTLSKQFAEQYLQTTGRASPF